MSDQKDQKDLKDEELDKVSGGFSPAGHPGGVSPAGKAPMGDVHERGDVHELGIRP